MITKFKLFENINENEPMVGDYVICKVKFSLEETPFKKYVDDNIGKIVKLFIDGAYYNGKDVKTYLVKFTNPKTYTFNKEQILYWSKNKEDLKDVLIANKYNL